MFVGDAGMWLVVSVTPASAGIRAEVHCGHFPYEGDVDPDAVVEVLVPVTEREALELTREQLGARVVERRTA